MKTQKRIILLFAVAGLLTTITAAASPPDGGEAETGVERPPVRSARAQVSLPLPPPLPSEYDIINSVLARFPKQNSGEVIRFVRRHFVEEMRDFARLSMHNREKAEKLFGEVMDKAIELLETKRRNPDKFRKLLKEKELENAARRLAKETAKSKGEERKEKLLELRRVLAEAFEVKQSIMKEEVRSMEKDLDELKGLVEQRDANSELIISRRLNEMAGEEEHLRW
ncbi:MAG: hypothetical protein R6V03_06460 [Kiritimatiellia bacterium]